MIKPKTFLMLGRNAEICNILPMMYYIHRTETTPTLIVSRIHEDILDGVTYVNKVVFPQSSNMLTEAQYFAHSIDPNYIPIQASGVLHHYRRTDSALLEPWAIAGYLEHYGLPLTFDNRDHDREAELVKSVNDRGRPIILCALDGISNPFAGAPTLIRLLNKRYPKANIVDLNEVKPVKYYDLLGLIEASQVLISIDCGILHLAKATTTPVVALTSKQNGEWYRSPQEDNHIYYASYGEYHGAAVNERTRMFSAIDKCLVENYYLPIALDHGLDLKTNPKRIKIRKTRKLSPKESARHSYLKGKLNRGIFMTPHEHRLYERLSRRLELTKENKALLKNSQI